MILAIRRETVERVGRVVVVPRITIVIDVPRVLGVVGVARARTGHQRFTHCMIKRRERQRTQQLLSYLFFGQQLS